MVDLFLVYSFIRKLVTPFSKWEANKLGIIDDDGKVLIKRKDFTKAAQRKAFGIFDVMILNLKKLLAKVPGGQSRLASYAAALWLIKEWQMFTDKPLLTEDVSDDIIESSVREFDLMFQELMSEVEEDAPNMSVASGAIAGMDGNHMSQAAQKRWTKKNKKDSEEMKTFKEFTEGDIEEISKDLAKKYADKARKDRKGMKGASDLFQTDKELRKQYNRTKGINRAKDREYGRGSYQRPKGKKPMYYDRDYKG
jgi:hypothetical protein